jgi:hypothetical protein
VNKKGLQILQRAHVFRSPSYTSDHSPIVARLKPLTSLAAQPAPQAELRYDPAKIRAAATDIAFDADWQALLSQLPGGPVQHCVQAFTRTAQNVLQLHGTVRVSPWMSFPLNFGPGYTPRTTEQDGNVQEEGRVYFKPYPKLHPLISGLGRNAFFFGFTVV